MVSNQNVNKMGTGAFHPKREKLNEFLKNNAETVWPVVNGRYVEVTDDTIEFEKIFHSGRSWDNTMRIDRFIEVNKLMQDEDGNFILPQ